jgi:phosphoribosylglycinamide formyltransferase 1
VTPPLVGSPGAATFPAMPSRIGVLASGGGSNLQALLDHLDRLGANRAAHVVLVVANAARAGALERARARGIATAVLDDHEDAAALQAALDVAGVDLVVLAGYLKLVPASVVARYAGRMLNVHPALLPAFGGPGMYGRRVHEAVLRSGARVSGVTVHFVDEAYDRGAIIAQWPVPVRADDTPDSLAARVLRAEHLLLPRVAALVAAGRVTLGADGRVDAGGAPATRFDVPPDMFAPADDGAAASGIERTLRL